MLLRLADREQVEENEKRAWARADYKRFSRDESSGKIQLLFYSAQKGYYKYFSGIIDEILKNSDIKIHYVTGDSTDNIFQNENQRIIPYYISEDKIEALIMKARANVVVMTDSDINGEALTRSRLRKNTEYIYVPHSCASLNFNYRAGTFDCFDTVFAAGQGQADEIRAIERLRGTKAKKIINTGYGPIDNMVISYEAIERKENGGKVILVAPSWQENNILDRCLDELLDGIINRGFKIIVRPHPMYAKKFPERVNGIFEKYKVYFMDNFIIETDYSSDSAVYTADLLITDRSEAAYEYSFAANKPVLFINTGMKSVNPDYNKIDVVPLDIKGRDIVGKSIEMSSVNKIYEVICGMLDSRDSFCGQIDRLKKEHLFNLSGAGRAGAEYIIGRIK